MPLEGVLRLQRVASPEAEARPGSEASVREVAVSGGVVEIPLPKESWWKVEADIPGYWLPPTVIDSRREEANLRLVRAGEVRVRTAVPRNERPPEELTVRFVPPSRDILLRPREEPPPEPHALRGQSRCQRGAVGEWTCALPSGDLDLRFHASGFASEFLWKVPVPAGRTIDLGRLALVPGAAVLGRLELPSDPELDPESVGLELAPETFESLNPQVRRLSRTAVLHESGLFQFRDLAPGTYRLTAHAEGWAPAERTSIEVRAGLETELIWPLELQRPAAIEICFDPPVPPGVRLPADTWKAVLHAETTELRQPLLGTVGEDGCWRQTEVQPGWYRLTVTDGRRSHWLERRISIPPGDFRLDLELPLIAVEGTITRGGQPIRARLTFERVRPAEGDEPAQTRQMVFYSDPEGVFSGALTEEGRWWVKAGFNGSRSEQLLEAVEIERPQRGPLAIDLEVPDTRLTGRVVNEDGEGIARVPISAFRVPIDPVDGSAAKSRTDADGEGRFSLEGLPAGRYRVSAFTAGGSAQAEVDVLELTESPELELVIGDGIELAGRVVSARGPVIGARILALPELERPRAIAMQNVITDVTGEFTLSVPADAVSLRLLVLPPGHAARMLRVAADQQGPLVVTVDDVGGTLVVDGGGSAGLLEGSHLVAGDVAFALLHFRDWSLLGTSQPPGLDGSWTLPMMSAGDYALCAPGDEPCERGFLAPFDTLVLSLPSAEASRESPAGR
jgi:hypothetical protein